MKIRFISIDQEQISVKLDSVGELLESGFTYKTDSVAQTNYQIGSVIAANQYIEFETTNISKDSSNYYQFATSGADIELSGSLDSNQNYAFYNLFKNCKNIVDASQLSVGESVGKYSHANMFESCTKLTTPPTSLASGALRQWCYSGMFNNCSSLTAVPQLPSNDLALCCYNSMFYKCKSLESGPVLSASELAPFCYNSMFNMCYNLKDAPVLSVSTLVNGCYKNMFMDCKKLSSITVGFEQWNENYTGNWVKGVGPYGTFNRPNALVEEYGNSKIPLGWDRIKQTITIDQIPQLVFDDDHLSADITEYVHYTGSYPVYYMINGTLPKGLTFENGVFTYDIDQVQEETEAEVRLIAVAKDAEAVMSDLSVETKISFLRPLTFKAQWSWGQISLQAHDSPSPISLDYKKNDGAWTTYTVGDVINLTSGETVSFSGANDHFSDSGNYYRFNMPSKTKVYGNIQSLLNYSDTAPEFCFWNLFSDNLGGLVDASELILGATTLAEGCYLSMFNKCTHLSAAPIILATDLSVRSCQGMFQRCDNLSTAPQLPATGMAQWCYRNMFSRCQSLTTPPSILPAATLDVSCYENMFYYCTSLTSAPQLPATTLAPGCYQSMFKVCTSLIDAPELPVTTLALPLARRCYKQMFVDCSSLTSINVSFTDWSFIDEGRYTNNWVEDVAPTGIFYKPSALAEQYGVSRIPPGWTVVNED